MLHSRKLRHCTAPRRTPSAALLAGLILVLAAVTAVPASAAGRRRHHRHRHGSLSAQIRTILRDPEISHAHFGISAVTLSGRPVYALNEAQYFEPASNAKLFTTAALLSLLPSDATWTTDVVTSGKVQDGTVTGNLVILGVGDPTMSGRAYPYEGHTERPNPPLQALQGLADQIVADGIHRIDGDIVGNDAWFPWEPYGSDWAWDDLQWDYGAPASALTINDNVDYLNVAPSPLRQPTVVTWNPDVPYYTLENSLTSVPGFAPASYGIDRAPGSLKIRLFGSINDRGLHEALAVQDPARFAAIALRQMLLARGVDVQGKAVAQHRYSDDTQDFRKEVDEPIVLHRLNLATIRQPEAGVRVLATHVSPPLAEDVKVTLKVSQNLHAELYLRLLGRLEGSDGSIAEGARVVHEFLIRAGIDPDDFVFFDGSGLSRADLITPRAATTLLVYAAHRPWGSIYRDALPVGGVDGTLSDRFTTGPLHERIFAKTGTLGEASTLSGYLIARSGKTLAFSVLCNDRNPTGHAARRAIDQIVTAIAEDN